MLGILRIELIILYCYFIILLFFLKDASKLLESSITKDVLKMIEKIMANIRDNEV
jgi:hypothetical protein